jgi:RHS repeat-associated protein
VNASDQSAINSYGYTYDPNGQITSFTSTDGTINYTYDHDGELVGATGTGLPSSDSYAYDANGNRNSTGYTTGTDNELTSDGTYDYAYDADGNLITQTTIATGATENFTWDYRNRLTEITYKNSSGTTTGTVQYTYNVFNQRISQKVTNGSGTVTLDENYIYDGDNLLMVINGSGTITDRYLFGPGSNQVLADNASGGTTWMLADQQGTIRDVVNSGGSVVDHIVYDPYGNILSQTSLSNQPRFGFDGMQLDAATGLYYDNARYYDASTGKFITQDPIGFAGGTADLYEYVLNDPMNFADRSGFISAGAGAPHPVGGTSANETAGGIAISAGILVTGPALVIAGAAVTAPTLVAVAAAGTEEGVEAAPIVEGTAQAEAEAEAEASANAEDSPPNEEDPEECDSGDPEDVTDPESHHLQVKQFYGDNAAPLQDLPADMHEELHDLIGQAIDDEFAGEGAPSAYNGGQAVWEQFFADNPDAFARADAVINMVTQDYLEENGIW